MGMGLPFACGGDIFIEFITSFYGIFDKFFLLWGKNQSPKKYDAVACTLIIPSIPRRLCRPFLWASPIVASCEADGT